MRVALVIQKLAGLRGGAERVAIELAGALARRGHEVVLVSYEHTTGPPGYDVGDVPIIDLFPRPLRAVITRLPARGGAESLESYASGRGNAGPVARLKWHATHGWFARRLASWLRAHPQDVVVGFLPPAISAVSLAAARLGEERPRVVASTHNVPSEDFGDTARWDRNPVARRTNLWALDAADAVTVLLPEFVQQLPEAAQAHAVVLPNAVARLAPSSGAPRRPLVLGVGRLTNVKRFDILVEAFAAIAADVPNWEVAIYGEGPERPRLEELIVQRGLGGRMQLLGTTSDIAAAYDEARILAHPAVFEGFGLSVAEAILHGVDVLASQSCTSVNQLVEHDATGLLVQEGEDPVAAFAAGLRRLIDNPPSAATHAAAADRLADRLAPARVYDDWETVLRG